MAGSKLSIIIPVFNVQNYLKQCINSFHLYNKYKSTDVEIILIDDGSTDESKNICDDLAKKYEIIKSIHIQNSGQSVARNIGLEHANGRWILYVDSDDIVRNGYIEWALSVINDVGSNDIVMFDFKPFISLDSITKYNSLLQYNSEKLKVVTKDNAMYYLTTSKYGNYLWNKIFPREVLEQVKLPEGQIYEDIATAYKYFEACNKVRIYKDVVYYYRQRSGSSVHLINPIDQYKSMIEAVKSRIAQLEFFYNNRYFKAYKNAKYGLMLNSISLIKITLKNGFQKTSEFYKARLFLKNYSCNLKRDGLKRYVFLRIYKILPQLCEWLMRKKR